MTFVLNTDEVDERERRDFVHYALGATIVPIELHWPDRREGTKARGTITELGALTLCSGRTTAERVERTSALARDSLEPSVFVNVQRFGTSTVLQNGRYAVARPGDLVMYDTTTPYTLVNDTGVSGDFFRIPQSVLALPHDVIERASAVRLSPGHPITSLTNDYLRRVAADPDLSAAPDGDLVARPTVELIRALILTHVRAGDPGAREVMDGLEIRILEYARQHLAEPDLTAERIAAAIHISVRYLYKVLARNEVGLADWIRSRRLEACQRELTTEAPSTAISVIARRNGFSNLSSFSRTFHRAFGMTPTEWRDLHRR